MTRFFKRLLSDQRGATAIEYGLILALMTLALVGGLTNFANTTIEKWNFVADEVGKH